MSTNNVFPPPPVLRRSYRIMSRLVTDKNDNEHNVKVETNDEEKWTVIHTYETIAAVVWVGTFASNPMGWDDAHAAFDAACHDVSNNIEFTDEISSLRAVAQLTALAYAEADSDDDT
jgi:hypothetical protein